MFKPVLHRTHRIYGIRILPFTQRLFLVHGCLSIKVGKTLPVRDVAFDEFFGNVLVVKNELFFVLVKHFVVFQVASAKFLYRVIFKFEF